MVLRTARTAFLIAGVSLLLSAVGDVHRTVNANLAGQGSLAIEQDTGKMSTTELRQHWSAPEQARRSASGTIALGTLFILLGLGLHASLVRRQAAGRPVKVHRATEKSRTGTARRYWILRMNVRV